MSYLQRNVDSETTEFAEKIIKGGVESVVLPPSLQLGHETMGNLAKATTLYYFEII